MSKAQTDVVAALRIELDATKAALAKSEGASSALAAELERMVSAPNERAEKAEAACAALRACIEKWPRCGEPDGEVTCDRPKGHEGECICSYDWFGAHPDGLPLSEEVGEGWVSPEAHAKVVERVAELEAFIEEPPPTREEMDAVMERYEEIQAIHDAEDAEEEKHIARLVAERDEARADVAAHSAPCSECKGQMRVCMDCAEAALAALRAERDSLRERLGDAERVIEAARVYVRRTAQGIFAEGWKGADFDTALAEFDAKWGKR